MSDESRIDDRLCGGVPYDDGEQAILLRGQIGGALASRDTAEAVALALSAVREGRIDIADLYTRVLGPALVDTGSAWQRGAERVWEEHLTSATVRTIVEALYPDVVAAAANVPSRGRALLACPPGEQHDLGLRMLADRFRLAGWDTTFLGADTPADDIVDAAEELHVDIVVLSASTHFNRVLLRSTVDDIHHRLPRARLCVGGPAFNCDEEGYCGLMLDAAELGLPGREPIEPADSSATEA